MAVLIGLALVACSGAQDPAPEPADPRPPPPPPPSPLVTALELVPPSVSGVLAVEVEALLAHQRGRELLRALQGVAELERWEQAAGVELEQNVRRMVFFAQVSEQERSRADLSRALRRRMVIWASVVFERSDQGDAVCRRSDLEQLRSQPVDGPMRQGYRASCGPYVMLTCCHPEPMAWTANDSGAARAITSAAGPAPGMERVATMTVGPDLVDRAGCEQGTVALTGWHWATLDLGQGLDLRAILHGATPAEAPALRDCLQTGVGELAGHPMIQHFGVSDLLTTVEIDLDARDDKDVSVSASFSEQQVDFLMTLLSLIEGGGSAP